MKQGDFVIRKSYGGDVLFRIDTFKPNAAIIKGTDYRLLADSPLSDLSVVNDPDSLGASRQVRIKVTESMRRMQREQAQLTGSADRIGVPILQHYFEIPGKVLHLDGDGGYMTKSMQIYEQLRVPAYGVHSHESTMAELLFRLLPQVKPDIVVITGHDGVLKNRPQGSYQQLSSYKNSQNFVNAVRVAREYERNRDGLIIVAGACQSHFEALLQAGANFASSPGRILIHALDPVYVAIKASFTSIKDTVSLTEAIQGTISGPDGVGGIETFGKYRVGLPKPKILKNAVPKS
jgi:spore coat assembly protein